MPTYAYTCTVCGHAFDVHQSFDDAPMTVCPECTGRLRKVFSPVGVVFKGSGFYRTDARGPSRTTKEPAAASASSSSSEKSSTDSSGGTTSPSTTSSTGSSGAGTTSSATPKAAAS